MTTASGKTAVVTGATSGIGLAVCQALAGEGFTVMGIGRSSERCRLAREAVLAACPGCRCDFFTADLMQQREVRRVSAEIMAVLEQEHAGRLDILINNAGCVRSRYNTSEDGVEQQFALNHLAAFLLTHGLWPALTQAGGRVLITSSQSHQTARMHWQDLSLQRGYQPLRAYKQSKLANVLMARAVNDRYLQMGVRAYAVDPGLVRTDIGLKDTGWLVKAVWSIRRLGGQMPDASARTYLWLCTAEPAPSGLYYGHGREQACSGQVTKTEADRLFAVSEQYCRISFGNP